MTKGEAIRIVVGLYLGAIVEQRHTFAIKRLLQEVKRDGRA